MAALVVASSVIVEDYAYCDCGKSSIESGQILGTAFSRVMRKKWNCEGLSLVCNAAHLCISTNQYTTIKQ